MMLTEQEARELLTKAAGTIDVPPQSPITRARRPVWPVLAGAVGVAAVVTISVMVSGLSSDPEPAPAPTAPTSSIPHPNRAPVVVPRVVGLSEPVAEKRLEDLGFRVTRHLIARACLPTPRIVAQFPAAGTMLSVGESVSLNMVGDDGVACAGTPADADPGGSGARFVEFARGERDAPPVAPEVDLYVGNELVTTLTRAQAADPAAWRVCPASGSYAARTCPFSALTPLRQTSDLALDSAAPDHACLPTSPPLPERLTRYRSLTLTDAHPATCVSYFAVQLFMDDSGRVAAVNVVWAEP